MRVLIAGATGAIGRPLIRCLKQDRHTVFALARSPESSQVVTHLGVEPVTADALDTASVKAALDRTRPDAIINELTALPRHYTAAEMRAAAERDRKVRIEGNANLLAALRGWVYAATYCRAQHTGTHRAKASPMKARPSPLMRRQRSLPARAATPNSKPRHWPHPALHLSVCVTASSMVRAPGFTMTEIWASRSANSGFQS